MSLVRLRFASYFLNRPSRLSWVLVELWGRPVIPWRQRLSNAWWQIRHYGDSEAFDALYQTWERSTR